MSARTADSDWDHLYPVFREKLWKVLKETERLSGHPWVMTEGYRSPERQLHLYAQGRTRPGPVVTWMRIPRSHGGGMAADCYPSTNGKTPNFKIGKSAYDIFRSVYLKQGLTNGAWGKADWGHVEWPLGDTATRARAREWVRAGFPPLGTSLGALAPEIPVVVNGEEVRDADAFLRDGHVWLALRPVADALDVSIARVQGGQAELVDDEREWAVPLEMREGRGFILASALRALGATVDLRAGTLEVRRG